MHWRLISFLLCFVPAFCFADVKTIDGVPLNKVRAVNGVPIAKVKTWNGFAVGDVGGGGTPPEPEPELTCLVFASNTTYNNTLGISRYNGNQYYGIIFNGNSTSGSICKVSIRMIAPSGDISSKVYYFELWTLYESRNFNSLVGRSSGVAGNNSWNGTNVEFAFSTPVEFDCTSGAEYGLVIKAILNTDAASQAGRYDGSNYAYSRYDSTENSFSCSTGVARWYGNGALFSTSSGHTPGMVIYTMQPEDD